MSGDTFERFHAREDVRAVAARVGPGCGSFFYAPTAGAFPDWKYRIEAQALREPSVIPMRSHPPRRPSSR